MCVCVCVCVVEWSRALDVRLSEWCCSVYTDGQVTIFQIRSQTLMKLVGQAKYPST